jgi:hypothetical protein
MSEKTAKGGKSDKRGGGKAKCERQKREGRERGLLN